MTCRYRLANPCLFLLLFAALAVLLDPGCAFASGGISEFSSPLEKVVNTVTGTAGKLISIAALAIAGFMYLFNRDDISGGFKILLQLIMGISIVCFAGGIVNSVFSFSGALV